MGTYSPNVVPPMSLFGSPMPKGITEKELTYIRGELRGSGFGSSPERFTEMEVNTVMEMLRMGLDADSYAERQHHQGIIDQGEADMVEKNMANRGGIHLTPTKQAHLHAVLKKYLDQNIIHGIFS